MSGSVMKLKKKIWKISEKEVSSPSFKQAHDSKAADSREESIKQRKSPGDHARKQLVVSDLHMGKLSRNKSLQFDNKKE